MRVFEKEERYYLRKNGVTLSFKRLPNSEVLIEMTEPAAMTITQDELEELRSVVLFDLWVLTKPQCHDACTYEQFVDETRPAATALEIERDF